LIEGFPEGEEAFCAAAMASKPRKEVKRISGLEGAGQEREGA
jgi:hypothetical protein